MSLPLPDPLAVAVQLAAPRTVLALGPGGRGGNNRLYRVETDQGTLALKLYPRLAGDSRDRLGTEFAALTFLTGQGFADIPAALARADAEGCALYQWIEGVPPTAIGTDDLGAAAAFAGRLKQASTAECGQELPLASEACLSAVELERQIVARHQRLAAIGHDVLDSFLHECYRPAQERLILAARQGYERLKLDWDADLAADQRMLSPSDFGFHNALRRDDGRLVFLDFEYFGWDDPAKLLCDFLLHPGMALTRSQQAEFSIALTAALALDDRFLHRARLLYPLYGLRWCMILLNEFLPERWQRRAFAGAADRAQAEQRQLTKARTLLKDLHEHNPLDRPV